LQPIIRWYIFTPTKDNYVVNIQLILGNKMSKTLENLKEAFAGESQANQKYRAFAVKAEKDGMPNIAKLFNTAAEAERIHAEGHLKAMDAVNSTVENLKAAIGGETYEFENMYPPMHEEAEVEGHKAKRMFKFALDAEKVHAQLYSIALKAAEEGKDLDTSEIYLCPVCGNIEFGKPEENCPICGVAAAKYLQV
jgi:rubrerythrin